MEWTVSSPGSGASATLCCIIHAEKEVGTKSDQKLVGADLTLFVDSLLETRLTIFSSLPTTTKEKLFFFKNEMNIQTPLTSSLNTLRS